MTKLRKSGVKSARRGSADAKAWTVITPAQKREAIPYSEVPLASEIDVLRPEPFGAFLTGLLLADKKYLADGEAFSGKDF